MTDRSVNEVKKRILEVALEVYTAKPPHEVTVDEIAKKAGVSKGLIFYHFKNKYNLEKEVMGLIYKMIFESLKGVGSVDELLDRMCQNLLKLPNIVRFIAYLSGKVMVYGEYDYFKKAFDEAMEFVTPLFMKEDIADPKKVAIAIMALFDGLSIYSLFYDIGDVDDYKKIALDLIKCRKKEEV
ncbi:Transcriptional regulator [Archaeoglobus sulfaticallidus PM70-1]|uniref:Transcriptional regulator n=1 Tax=Archaeoglobus sulfaticallidus PM70-1 TaxID=387631 RepID=N0BD17_9EURY|nr:TetR/AcrR family transcriptional regulator [Archaeoglobus sulfaticallidus]AGK60132.1 Transcriptional regulator [Archaeoglobus sulfaticallidus PM70-1]